MSHWCAAEVFFRLIGVENGNGFETCQTSSSPTSSRLAADQGDTGDRAAAAAEAHEIELEVVKHTEAKKGFVLLPRRWVVERTFGWLGRHRRLARDDERLTQTLGGYHWVAYLGIVLERIITASA